MIYYLESPSKRMVRLSDIPNTGGGFRPSGVTFIKRKDGYTAYVTSTISSHIKTIALVNNTATLTGYVFICLSTLAPSLFRGLSALRDMIGSAGA